MTASETKPNWCFIAIECNKEHWDLPAELKAAVGTIYGTYAFNRSEQVHCCEIRPSYYTMCLGYDWTWGESYHDLTEKERDRLHELANDLIFGAIDDGDGGYYHVSFIEKLITKDSNRFHEAGEIDPDFDRSSGDEYELVADYWKPNPKF